MPIYSFECSECKAISERLVSDTRQQTASCRTCGKPAKRIFAVSQFASPRIVESYGNLPDAQLWDRVVGKQSEMLKEHDLKEQLNRKNDIVASGGKAVYNLDKNLPIEQQGYHKASESEEKFLAERGKVEPVVNEVFK